MHILLLVLLLSSSPMLPLYAQSTEASESAEDSVSGDTDDGAELDTLLPENSGEGDDGDTDTTDDSTLNDDSEEEDDPLLAPDTDDDSSSDEEAEDDGPGPFSATDGADVNLPIIGLLVCPPAQENSDNQTASEAGHNRKKAADAAEKKSCPIGRAALSEITGTIDAKGHLKLQGKCSLKGEDGTLAVSKYDEKENELILKLTYQKPLEFEILPDKKIAVKEFLLTLSAQEQTLTTKESLFTSGSKDTTIKFGLLPNENTAAAHVEKEIPFTSVVPSAKGNKDAETIQLSDVSITFPNPLDPGAALLEAGGLPSIMLTATAKLDQIVLYKNAHLSNSDASITFQGPSISFDAQGTTPIKLDSDITLDAPRIGIDIAAGGGIPDLELAGTLITELPVVGALKVPMTGRKSDGAFEMTGKLGNSFDFGPVTFKEPQIRLASSGMSAAAGGGGKSLELEVFASFNMFGLTIIPKLKFLKPGEMAQGMGAAAAQRGSSRIVMFSGEVNGGKPIKPLQYIPGIKEIPGIADFVMESARLGLDTTKKTFLGGRTTLLGLAVDAKIGLIGVKNIVGSFTKPWKISDSISALKGTVFDSFVFENINIGYSAGTYLDPESGMLMQRGLNLSGSLDMSQGIFEKLRKIFGPVLPKRLNGTVTLRPNPRDCMVQLGIPLDIKLSSRVSLHNIVFEISGAPAFAIQLSLKVIVGKNEPPLLFTARIEFDPAFFEISGSMNGTWKHPFGIPGLTVSDIAVEATLPYSLIPPIGFGVTGAVVLGSTRAMLAVKLSPDTIMAIAELNKWPLFCLPGLLEMTGLKLGGLDFLKAIDIAFYDLKFKFAPTGGQIGTIYFDPGLGASGKLVLNIPHVLKAKLDMGFNLDWMGGFKLWAKMPKFNLGPLKITGKGPDRKWNTADDGPVMYMALSLTEQRIFVSALVELFGSSSEIEIDVGLTHLRFKMLMKLLGFLNAHIVGETYHKGWRVGFKAMGTAKIGKKAEVTLFGDINTLGCNFAGKYDALTLRDLADLCHIPSDVIPEFGIKEVEFYVNAQG